MGDEGEGGDSGSHGGGEGSGHTRPLKASSFRKGSFILLKGKPCKVVSMSTSKTGKHGHAKVKFTGIDIYTQKKYQELQASTHPMMEVIVTKAEYFVADIDAKSGQMSLLDSENNAYDGITLDTTKFTQTGADLSIDAQVYNAFKGLPEGQELMVSVTRAMGHEMVMSFKLVSESS